MKLAVILLNYNTSKDTVVCLKSLATAKIPGGMAVTVYVVDNGSSQPLPDVSQLFPHIVRLDSKINLGFSGGNNLGLTAALKDGATHILLLNNDTYVDQSFFTSIYQSVIIQPQIGIVSGKIYFAPGFEFHAKRYSKKDLGKVIWYAGGSYDWANALGSHAHVDEVDSQKLSSAQPTDFATGCCLLFRAEVASQIGLLNPDYFLYLEDLEFCQRARLRGWKIYFDPSIVLWHKVSRSAGGSGSKLNDYFITRNRLLFGLTYAPLRTKLALIRESVKMLMTGTPPQRLAVLDFYSHKLGKGSFLK